MQHNFEEEYTVECSGRIILECKGCNENTILLGTEEDWVSERRTDFISEEVLSVMRCYAETSGLRIEVKPRIARETEMLPEVCQEQPCSRL